MLALLVTLPATLMEVLLPKLSAPEVTCRLPAIIIEALNAPTVPILLQVKLPKVVALPKPAGLLLLTPFTLQVEVAFQIADGIVPPSRVMEVSTACIHINITGSGNSGTAGRNIFQRTTHVKVEWLL